MHKITHFCIISYMKYANKHSMVIKNFSKCFEYALLVTKSALIFTIILLFELSSVPRGSSFFTPQTVSYRYFCRHPPSFERSGKSGE